jgi:hypothetical protein
VATWLLWWEAMVGVLCVFGRVEMLGCVDGCREAIKAPENGTNKGPKIQNITITRSKNKCRLPLQDVYAAGESCTQTETAVETLNCLDSSVASGLQKCHSKPHGLVLILLCLLHTVRPREPCGPVQSSSLLSEPGLASPSPLLEC